MFDVCVVGSANLDLVARAPRIPRPGETVLGTDYAEHAGGKGLNQAVAAVRSGATVAFVGAVGDDEPGRRLRRLMGDEGIDTTRLASVTGPTGRAAIVVDQAGENSIVVVPGANSSVAADPSSELPDSRVFLVQLEIPLAAVHRAVDEGRRRGASTILNPAPARDLPNELIAACDIVIPNQHELTLLGGAAPLLAAGCRAVVVTKGGDGVDVVTANGTTHVAAFAVDVVDTTGAGDAFCGALAARLAAGHDLAGAVVWAAAAGALATTVPGAVPGQPAAASVAALVSTRG